MIALVSAEKANANKSNAKERYRKCKPLSLSAVRTIANIEKSM
jgi:hypothetical protein